MNSIAHEIQQGRLFGLSVQEWAVLIPLLGAFVVAVIKAIKGHKAEKKNEVLTDAIEEGAHNEASAKHVKALAQSKAMLRGLESGVWGLKKDKERATSRLKIKNGGTDEG